MRRRLSLALLPAVILVACGRADLPTPTPSAIRQLQARARPLEHPASAQLFRVWEEETRAQDPAYVSLLNENTLNALAARPPVAGALGFSEKDATLALQDIQNNIVTSERTKYEQPGTAIGYCFGRAMFVHLNALKKKLKKGQIRKLWAVGSMKSPYYNWAFHVATVIQDGATGEWRVVDSFLGRPVSPREWFKVFQAQNEADRDLRIYVTAPEKFTPDLGKYSRVQLGLDLSREEDWYRHYFADLMKTLRIREHHAGFLSAN